MSLFVAVILNEAVLAYKAPLVVKFMVKDRARLKFFHTICHSLSAVCIILGLLSIASYKNAISDPKYPTFDSMYSAHSWLGVVLIGIWVLQGCCGIIKFCMKRTKQDVSQEKKIVAVHHFFGYCIYALGLTTCALGFQSMQTSDIADFEYSSGSVDSQLSSASCVLLFSLGVATFAVLAAFPDAVAPVSGTADLD
jgi:cytochrome b561